MNQDIGFYNKHIFYSNSYLKRYYTNKIVRYSLDNNLGNKRMNDLIDIYLNNNYYITDKKIDKKINKPFKNLNKIVKDKSNNTNNIEKCDFSTNTINKIMIDNSTNTGKEFVYNLKNPIMNVKKDSYSFNHNNCDASIINRIRVNDKLNLK